MEKIKETKFPNGRIMHYGIGAVIEKDGKYLLIDRAVKPLGYGCISGHINESESPEEALVREVMEEANLKVLSHKLLLERVIKNRECKLGKVMHHCYIYETQIKRKDKLDGNREVKSISWYSKDEIKKLKLEPLWKFYFKKIGVI